MNVFTERLEWVPDKAALSREIGDDDCRKFVLSELEKFDRLAAERDKLDSIRDCWDGLDALKKAGVAIPEESIRAAFHKWQEDDRQKVKEYITGILLARFCSAVEPELRKGAKRLIKSLRDDVRELNEVTDRIAKKHGASIHRSNLAKGLEAIIASFEEDVKKPLDLSWHYSPRIALSGNFKEPL